MRLWRYAVRSSCNSSVVQSTAAASHASSEVSVIISVKASSWEVWRALTEPHRVSSWFGTLETGLRVGKTNRLVFGDGDFFVLEVLHMDPPHSLQYAWRFLGIGPQDTITWN